MIFTIFFEKDSCPPQVFPQRPTSKVNLYLLFSFDSLIISYLFPWLHPLPGNLCESLSRVQLFETLWTVARQVLLSTGFPRQEYWSLLPFPSPGELPNLGIKPRSPNSKRILYCLIYGGSPICINRSWLINHFCSFFINTFVVM